MICKKCGKEIDGNATFCQFCGEKIETEKNEQAKPSFKSKITKRKLMVYGIPLLVLIIIAGYVFSAAIFTNESGGLNQSKQNKSISGTQKEEGDIELVKVRTEKIEYDSSLKFSIYVKNNNDFPIEDVSFSVSYLDSSNTILDSGYASYNGRVLSGQIVAADGFTIEKSNATKLQIDGCKYKDLNRQYYEVVYEDLETADITKPNEKIYSDESTFSDSAINSAVKVDEKEDKLIVGNLKASSSDDGSSKVECTVKNNTGKTIKGLTIYFIFLNEKGNIVRREIGIENSNIKDGQSIVMSETLYSLPDDAKFFTVDGFKYNDGKDTILGYLSVIPKACKME